MIIDTKVNVNHKEFLGENIKQYSGGTRLDGDDHGTHTLSVVIKGNNLVDPLKKKHTYIACSNFSSLNIGCWQLAKKLKVDVVNYSVYGHIPLPEEETIIKELAIAGTKMFFAAGNDGEDINKKDNESYPAIYANKYSNVRAIANVDDRGKLQAVSNYGKGTEKWPGVQVYGAAYNGKYTTLTGTSQACAVATHVYLKSLEK